jgi:hypothetical protein
MLIVARAKNNRWQRAAGLRKRKPINAWHADIQQYHVGLQRQYRRERARTIVRFAHNVNPAKLGQQAAHPRPRWRFVVDN